MHALFDWVFGIFYPELGRAFIRSALPDDEIFFSQPCGLSGLQAVADHKGFVFVQVYHYYLPFRCVALKAVLG